METCRLVKDTYNQFTDIRAPSGFLHITALIGLPRTRKSEKLASVSVVTTYRLTTVEIFFFSKCPPGSLQIQTNFCSFTAVCLSVFSAAVCKQGCHHIHGFCSEPGECK